VEGSQPGLTGDAIFELTRPSDPVLTPDGRQVAYVVTSADPGSDRTLSTIWLGSTVGSGRAREVVGSLWSDRSPRFSPDGRSLAWITRVDEFWEIRVRNLATRATRSLAVGSEPPGSIAWSPLGHSLAFTRRDAIPGGADASVELFVVPAGGGRVRRLLRDGSARGKIDLHTRLEWAPEGQAILVSLDPSDGEAGDTEIFEIEVTTGQARRLSDRRGPDEEPSVSPDGSFVAYTGYDAVDGHSGTPRLYVIERAGAGPPRLISRTVDAPVRHPAWSPDGRGIYAVIGEEGDRLAIFGLDGTARILEEQVEPAGLDPASPMFSVSRDSVQPRFAVVTSSPDHLPQVSVREPASAGVARALTMANSSLDTRSLGKVREVRADDRVRGWVLLPPDFEEGTRVSLVVDRRGGESGPPRRGFDLDRQILAGAGYAVLWARSPSEDPGALIQAVEAGGWVGSDRIFQLGGRAGGDGILARAPWGTAVTPGERRERIDGVVARFGAAESGGT